MTNISHLPECVKRDIICLVEVTPSLLQVPSKLLLQIPRFGKEFKMYNRIIPSLTLDVIPLLDPSKYMHSCR